MGAQVLAMGRQLQDIGLGEHTQRRGRDVGHVGRER